MRVDAARIEVVHDIDRVLRDDALRHACNGVLGQPGDAGEQQQRIAVANLRDQGQRVGGYLPDSLQRKHGQDQARGPPAAAGHGASVVLHA